MGFLARTRPPADHADGLFAVVPDGAAPPEVRDPHGERRTVRPTSIGTVILAGLAPGTTITFHGTDGSRWAVVALGR